MAQCQRATLPRGSALWLRSRPSWWPRTILENETGKRVLHIDSYHEGNYWNTAIFGTVKATSADTGAELMMVRMDTKRNPSLEFKQQAALDAKSVIDHFKLLGRNSRFLDREVNVESWEVENRNAFMEASFDRVLDHGQGEFLFACHYLKLLTAVRSELSWQSAAPWGSLLLAATNRFLNSPIKRKQVLRTANQALSFVAKEG